MMSEVLGPHLRAIYRYPVKGLTPEAMSEVNVGPAETLPFDRAYAIENGPGRFDPMAPRHLPKINFLMLMRDERLATLRADFDDKSQTLTIFRDGKQVSRGQLTAPLGRQILEQFFAGYMKSELRGAPKIVQAPNHSFSDVSVKCVHIVNLASVRELERTLGRRVDPLRFRANLYLDGMEPWSEFRWLDKTIEVGAVSLGVFARTQRCEATNVDPSNGARDMAIPAQLQRTWGHSDFGVYAKIVTGGRLAPDMPIVAP
jgi:uncharacterized protein YcbX